MAYQKIEYKCEKCGCNEVEIIPTKYGTAAMCTKCMNIIKLNNVVSNSNQPKCPFCKSINIKRIGTVNRMISTSLFGLSSRKIGKQWHCNSCGSDF